MIPNIFLTSSPPSITSRSTPPYSAPRPLGRCFQATLPKLIQDARAVALVTRKCFRSTSFGPLGSRCRWELLPENEGGSGHQELLYVAVILRNLAKIGQVKSFKLQDVCITMFFFIRHAMAQTWVPKRLANLVILNDSDVSQATSC